MDQPSSVHLGAVGASRYQAQRGTARGATTEEEAQLAGISTPAIPFPTASGLYSPEVQHIRDMARMYGLFIESHSLHVTLGAGEEGKEQLGWGECGEVVQMDKPVLQTHNSLSRQQK